MTYFKKNILLLSIFIGITSCSMNAQDYQLKSPDGNLKLTVKLTKEGTPTYSLVYGDKEVIKPSQMGFYVNSDFKIAGQKPIKDLVNGFSVIGKKTAHFDETWKPVWGEVLEIRNNYNELLVKLQQKETKLTNLNLFILW